MSGTSEIEEGSLLSAGIKVYDKLLSLCVNMDSIHSPAPLREFLPVFVLGAE